MSKHINIFPLTLSLFILDAIMNKMTLEDLLAINEAHPIMGISLTKQNATLLDLSKSNQSPHFLKIVDNNSLDSYIKSEIYNNQVDFGIGGYLEHRTVYQQFPHFENEGASRCIHLGVDVWSPAGSKLYAPFSSHVHSLKINDLPGDYGGTIILEHQIEKIIFYTLYGHLSHSSVTQLKKGDFIAKGHYFAKLGHEKENGGWPPHLHFQIIKDMQGYEGDYPGVVTCKNLPEMQLNCPDPNLILNYK